MPFDSSGLTISRSSYNSSCASNKKCTHYYKSQDSLSKVSLPGYFPDYFGEERSAIKVGDAIKMSCWSENNFVQNELSFFYSVDSVAPVLLTQLDQLYTSTYLNIPYTGAATGTLSLSFSRDPSNQIFLGIVGTNPYFQITSANKINMNFVIPQEFLPDPSYYSNTGFIGNLTSTNVNINTLPLVPINVKLVGNSISFAQSPDSNFTVNQFLPIQNQFFLYYGILLN